VLHDLWAKALVLDDESGGRVVIVTTDLIGLPREITDIVAEEVRKRHGLKRSQLLLNSSHTHTGPAVRPNLRVMYAWGPDEEKRSHAYARELGEKLVSVVGEALGAMMPANLSSGRGAVAFAVNRRERTPNGFRIGVNADGPMDHEVPVLIVSDRQGGQRAVVFGYACHNTTLTGEFHVVSGDYAGFAQMELEKSHPGLTSMFMMLCGADQNPAPRGRLELAAQHGKELADEVARVLKGDLGPLRPPLRTAFQQIKLRFDDHTREQFEVEAQAEDRFRQRRARLMLEAYDRGRPVRSVNYPVQAVRFGDGLTLIALGGEVVVDYSLRFKREFAGENLVVVGFCHDVMCYIPSARVLREGGYEAVESMIYYGQPGPFRGDIEETIFRAVRKVLRKTGAI
jgi:hypothetical protein